MDMPWGRTALYLVIGSMCVVSVARAEDDAIPPGALAIVAPLELQNDWTAKSNLGGERTNLHAKIEPELTFQATKELSFLLGLTLEQLESPERGRDEAFENQALFVKTLTANYESGPYGVFAGKFTPNFGRAWDMAPGLYADEFAKDYEFAERWGGGGSVAFDGTPMGQLEFSGSVFLVDRTALSESWITRRGRTTAADGGPGNTGDLSSFAVALDGAELPIFPALEYHLAYTQQAKGEGDTGTLRGFVASGQATMTLADDVEVTPLLEWARFDNFAGVRGADRTVWTAALKIARGPWQLVGAYAAREISGANDDRGLEISAGYTFANGMLAELGWWHLEEADERAEIIGVRLSYEFAMQMQLY